MTHADVVAEARWSLPHTLHFAEHGIVGEIGCDQVNMTATAISATKTVSELVFVPKYVDCYTTPNSDTIPVHVNGCTLKATVASGTTAITEQTIHLQCPTGASIKITHPNCTITTHPQTISNGVTYTTQMETLTKRHWITLDLNVQLATTRHGLCQLIGTNGVGTHYGSMLVYAFPPKSAVPVDLTAT